MAAGKAASFFFFLPYLAREVPLPLHYLNIR